MPPRCSAIIPNRKELGPTYLNVPGGLGESCIKSKKSDGSQFEFIITAIALNPVGTSSATPEVWVRSSSTVASVIRDLSNDW